MIVQATRQIFCRVYVGMGGVPADPTAKRVLAGSVLPGHKMTVLAFLGTVGTCDRARPHPSLQRPPGQLLRDIGEIGSVAIGMHAPRREHHPRHVQLLVGELAFRMVGLQLVDGAVELLAHGTRQLLVAGSGQRLAKAGKGLTPFFLRHARSLALRRRCSRSRLCRAANFPCNVPYCWPVAVVMKVALPTSIPITGACLGVSTCTCSS